MKYSELEPLLDEYFADNLPEDLRREVEEALGDSEECRRLRDAFGKLDARLVQNIQRPELPANFSARMMRKIDEAAAARTGERLERIRDSLEAEHQRRIKALRRTRLISGLGRLLDGVAWSALAGIAMGFVCAWLIQSGDFSFLPAESWFASPAACFAWGMALLALGLGFRARAGTKLMRWLG